MLQVFKIFIHLFLNGQEVDSQLIQYKTLHRTYITASKLHRMGFSHSDKCQHCPALTDNYYHAFWNCPPTQQFWSEVMDRLSEILGLVIPLCPIVALLNDLSSLSAPNHRKSFIFISLTSAKKLILLKWKDRTKISIKHWLNLLMDHCNLERLTANFKNNTKSFKETWSQFLQYIES